MYAFIAGKALPALVGLGIAVLGLWQAWTGNASMLHSYHRDLVLPQDEPKLARWSGCGLAVTGIGCIIMTFGSDEGAGKIPFYIGMALLFAGIVVAIFAIKRYNTKVF